MTHIHGTGKGWRDGENLQRAFPPLTPSAKPFTCFSRACPTPRKPRCGAGLSPSSRPYLGPHPAARRQGWRHRRQPGAVSSLPVPASRAGRSSAEQPQPGAREQAAAAEQQPRLSEPRRASSCASHMPAIAARCRAAGEPLAFSLPQDRGAQASRRARRFPGTCSRLSPREHTALLSGEEKSLARMFPLRQAGCLQAVAGLEMEASALCARGAACSTRGSPAPPAGVSPRAPQARRAGSTHVCTGISGLAEGTLFFPVGAGCSPGAAGRFKSSGC